LFFIIFEFFENFIKKVGQKLGNNTHVKLKSSKVLFIKGAEI